MKEPAPASASVPQQKLPPRPEDGLLQTGPAAMIQKQKAEDDVNIVISIVEDDAPVRGMLADWIRHTQGFRCAGVHGSAEAATSGDTA